MIPDHISHPSGNMLCNRFTDDIKKGVNTKDLNMFMHACIHTQAHRHALTCIHAGMHTLLHMCPHAHTLTLTHTHTHTHTHAHMRCSMQPCNANASW